MRILWVKSDFLHPASKGGRIRTLEILRHLHRWHEVHYAALSALGEEEGPQRAGEYSSKSYAVPHRVAHKHSTVFAAQLAKGLVSPTPMAVARFSSPAMGRLVRQLTERTRFDRVVCDFLAAAPNVPDLERAILFQHNVETLIWRRRVQHATNPIAKAYLRLQADRVFRYEGSVCRTAGRVVAVSPEDARAMRELFGVRTICEIPTGVDVEYFTPRTSAAPVADLVFCGSMDWQPNVDGVTYFLERILPRIRDRRPATTLAIVGRDASPQLHAGARQIGGVLVTGTVPDVRPYIWGARISVVPLRIGGGTRLKIYESMAAGVPVVSTTVGAEGLEVNHPENIRLADDPDGFADQCLTLLNSTEERTRMAESARRMVAERFTSEQVARRFEEVLLQGPCAHTLR